MGRQQHPSGYTRAVARWLRQRAAVVLAFTMAIGLATEGLFPAEAEAARRTPYYQSLKEAHHPDWMGKINDDVSLGRLSIPGTHDTLAIRGGDLVATQEDYGVSGATLRAQLDAGIRSIDIRVRVIGDNFTIHHGAFYQEANFSDVLLVLKTFLAERPSETVLLNLKAECTGSWPSCTDEPDTTTGDDRRRIFEKYRDTDPSRDVLYQPSVSGAGTIAVPNLGQVRGKAVLTQFRGPHGGPFGNLGLTQLYSDQDRAHHIQDEDYVASLDAIEGKWQKARNHFTRINADSNQNALYLNYLSGSSLLAYPYSVAGGSLGFRGVNEFALDYLQGGNASRTGAVIMDFPGGGLINAILAANATLPPPRAKVPRMAVMPLGDSITLGVGSSTRTGYRPALAAELADEAVTAQFVGSQVDADGVTRHEGHSGWRIDQLQAEIEAWLFEAKPNVVTLHIGTNDMNRDYQVATAPQRLGALIDQIHTASPDTAVVVASLVPATDPAVQARVNAYNAAIPGIVSSRAAQGYKITQVSMGGLTTADLNDNLHPNNAGYTKMASAFLGGVRELAHKGWIKETVVVKPAPPKRATSVGDYDVDINGDGLADYLVVDGNGATRAWLNNGTGGWTEQGYIASGSTDWTGSQVRFADVAGDGRADYLVVEPTGAVRAFVNLGGDGRGGWTDKGLIASGSAAWTGEQVRFADVGGDAYADYLVVDGNGATRAFLNTTNVTTNVIKWTDQGTIASGSAAWTGEQVRFADVGGDAYADYLVVDDNGATRAFVNTGGNGRGGWAEKGYIASGSANWLGRQIRFANVSGDARPEYLILDDSGAIRSFLNTTTPATGAIKWTDQGTIASGVGAPGHRVRI
ncbi:phosphatidylinositol-specific phospholipase C domain-containing protein [Streptomyces albipurpureus]|uniref:1-phosphatidylinositol phosphodiesterase n=1 Tax=Streptomyces albipurpureus TaxID=2897419 RepID=A0ABT0UK27_9ACTN|nr:phosphatidylinositol-specific phospholipase C domain-containing protein [Streptomyces sp. CWNU-1]MCM2388359.1 phosphatidylinositol-specific phospholipase C domain-containing protein [Streptomyces sp. CWNU-1]